MEQKFLTLMKEALEIEDGEVKMDDTFRDYNEWNSLSYLTVITMLDEEYGVGIETADFKKLTTIKELYNEVVKRTK